MTTELMRLLDWKLLKGSHEFPGSEGGTCINEAALVVAGFPYKSVSSASDLPKCFSRPISAFAIMLNDSMDDANRQRLIPFAVRLAGTADTREIERQRGRVAVLRTVREIVAPVFLKIGLSDVALKLQHCTWDDIKQVAAYAAYAAYAADAAYAAYAADAADAAYAADAADAAYAADAADAAYAAYAAKKAADAADAAKKAAYAAYAADAADAAYAAYAAERQRIWDVQLSILDEMLAIGKQAEPIETALILSRAAAAKCPRTHANV